MKNNNWKISWLSSLCDLRFPIFALDCRNHSGFKIPAGKWSYTFQGAWRSHQVTWESWYVLFQSWASPINHQVTWLGLTGLLITKLNLVNFCAVSFTYKFLLWKFFWFAFSIFWILTCSWHVPWTYAYDCFWDCIDDQSSSNFHMQIKIPNEL